jgi:hypothetical protein
MVFDNGLTHSLPVFLARERRELRWKMVQNIEEVIGEWKRRESWEQSF